MVNDTHKQLLRFRNKLRAVKEPDRIYTYIPKNQYHRYNYLQSYFLLSLKFIFFYLFKIISPKEGGSSADDNYISIMCQELYRKVDVSAELLLLCGFLSATVKIQLYCRLIYTTPGFSLFSESESVSKWLRRKNNNFEIQTWKTN